LRKKDFEITCDFVIVSSAVRSGTIVIGNTFMYGYVWKENCGIVRMPNRVTVHLQWPSHLHEIATFAPALKYLS